MEDIFFEVLPVPCCRKHIRRNNSLQGSSHLPYKRLRTEKSLFQPQSSQALEANFSLSQ